MDWIDWDGIQAPSLLGVASEKVRDRTLERLHYYANIVMTPIEIETDRFRFNLLQNTDRAVGQLVTYVWAERVQTQNTTCYFYAPANWWQHLRADVRVWASTHPRPSWIPRRVWQWLERLEVKERIFKRKVEFIHYVKYPGLRPGSVPETVAFKRDSEVDEYSPRWWVRD